ncbi:phospholipase SGR2-like isoform X2 [Andrographis paniculata]|nr:phospholipase SGR2-like isoform X2 [Andrographis paniculata]
MRDSLAIEASFLQREEELLSSWWQEYAECTEGPTEPCIVSKSTLQTKVCLPKTSGQQYAVVEERVGVPVKGGLYEVDLVRRHCFPVYWNGENRRVLRGHWFALKGGIEWLPLREDVSEQLEHVYCSQVWHRRTFQPSGLFAARVDLQGSVPGLHALFTGEDDTWEAWLNVDSSGFSGMVGFGRDGIKLRRGFAPSPSKNPTQDELRQRKEEEMDDYCSQVPVRHLVFMVHGVGQRLEKSNLVDDVGDFRQVTVNVAERHLTYHQLSTQRVLYIPCQWRKGLTFRGEVAVEKITLDGVRGLRTMLGATVHDILYYMSPIYCQEIIDSVSNQLNRLYVKFLKRNPGYNGKVSIYGHSLGSVLSFDILCHQDTLHSPFPMEWLYKECKRSEDSSTRDNVASTCNPTPHFKDEDCGNVAIESTVGAVDCLDILEDPVEGTSNPLGPPASSESDLSSTTNSDDQQTNFASLLNEDTNEGFHNSNSTDLDKSDMLNDPNSTKNDALFDDNGDEKALFHQGEAERVTISNEDVSDSNQYETIKLLQEEIVLLKAKIKELEAVCPEKGNAMSSGSLVNQSSPEGAPSGLRDSWKAYTPQIRYTKLEFKVDTFFAVGSPLGVFLALRNMRIGTGEGKEYWKDENITEQMPACRQMVNIFHPFDPVAYRIEPLICKEFVHKRPVIVPYHRGGKRLYVGFQEFKEGLASHAQSIANHWNTIKVKVLTVCESRHNNGPDGESEKPEQKERLYGSVMMERITGSEDGRVDHVLQDKTFRHQYISAIGSHTNYWRDPDTALFMLKHLYGDIPEDPPLVANDKDKVESKGKGKGGWSDPRKVSDAEVPLTFADAVFIKHFSHKVKKMGNNN